MFPRYPHICFDFIVLELNLVPTVGVCWEWFVKKSVVLGRRVKPGLLSVHTI